MSRIDSESVHNDQKSHSQLQSSSLLRMTDKVPIGHVIKDTRMPEACESWIFKSDLAREGECKCNALAALTVSILYLYPLLYYQLQFIICHGT